jgi:hypothetical protein
MPKYWFLDHEAYCYDRRCYPKEICILSDDGDLCYNYFIKTSNDDILPSDHPTVKFQFERHKLRLNFGDYDLDEAVHDIKLKVKNDTVYVKGLQKSDLWKKQLSNVIELTGIPSLKNLNNCIKERCDVKHGNSCARRKVFEMKFVYDIAKQQQQPIESQ